MLTPLDFAKMIVYFDQSYDTLGFGKNRIVFAGSSKDVIKVPYNFDGISSNCCELKPSAWIGGAERCARTWEDKTYSERFGTLILRMERLRLPKRGTKLPDWTGAVDCAQVGYDTKGRLVAYDWGV